MQLIPIPGVEIYYEEHLLALEEANEFFNALPTKCAWERHRASFGHFVPRDEAYYGGDGGGACWHTALSIRRTRQP